MATDGEPEVGYGRRGGLARGPALLAGGLLGTAGLLDVLVEVNLLTAEPYVVMTDEGMTSLHTAGWARAHLLVGVGVLIAGLVVATGRTWAAVVGVCSILTGATVDVLLLPFDPPHGTLVLGFHVAALVVLVRNWPRRSNPRTGTDRLTGSRRPAR